MVELKKKRTFYFPTEVDNHIESYAIKHGISRSTALIRIVSEHSEMPKLIEKSIKQYAKENEEKEANWKTAIRLSSRASEQNTLIILELLNQIVESMDYTPIDQSPSEAYLNAKREVKRKQDYFIRKAYDKKKEK